MGSRARIVAYASEDPIGPVRRAFEVIDLHDRVLSDYNPNSEARRLTAMPAGVWRPASAELMVALARSREAWEASSGGFDVTIGAVTALWRAATEENRRPTDAELTGARSRVGMGLIELDQGSGRVRLARDGMRLDFGGIGKGLAADAALESLRADGVAIALVEIGGDIAAGSPPPGAEGWRVRVADDAGSSRVFTLANRGVATSGDTHRFTEIDGVRASHVFSERTAEPLESTPSASVVAKKAWIADALATIARFAEGHALEVAAEKLGEAEVYQHGEE